MKRPTTIDNFSNFSMVSMEKFQKRYSRLRENDYACLENMSSIPLSMIVLSAESSYVLIRACVHRYITPSHAFRKIHNTTHSRHINLNSVMLSYLTPTLFKYEQTYNGRMTCSNLFRASTTPSTKYTKFVLNPFFHHTYYPSV